MARANSSDRGQDLLRITDQFRTRTGFVYELRCAGARLTLLVTHRAPDDTAGEWHVEASSTQVPAVAIGHAAATRADAVQKVGVEWSAEGAARGLPPFDWQGVAKVLASVRAI